MAKQKGKARKPGTSPAARPAPPAPRRASIAFLNCRNLFDPKACGRGPQERTELEEKTRRLARLLRGPKPAQPPAFVCLCEVGRANLGINVASEAFPAADYQPVWSHDGTLDADETGLLILYDQKVGTVNTASQLDRPLRNKGKRSRWLAARFSLPGAAQELGIVVNHWGSGIHSESDAAYDRRRTADEVADLFRGAATLRLGRGPHTFDRDEAVILVGDFNCDPFDPVFRLSDKGAWAASHARGAVEAARRASLPCFYNPLLKAPDIDGTLGGGLKSRMVDYLLFSQAFLTGGAFRYVGGSIRASAYDPAASDHLAIRATFEIL